MEENNNNFTTSSYKTVSGFTEKKHSSAKNVLVSFISGVVGASLVLGVCFSVPTIKDKLFTTSTTSQPTSNLNTGNSTLINLSEYSETGIGVAQKILPSIVGVTVEYTVNSMFYASGTAKASGTGVIISEDGYIVTNNHVVQASSNNAFYELSKANKVTVSLYNDDTEYEAEIVGTDEQTDLAVLKINKTGLTAAELENSDSVQVGEFAMAVGNPLGMEDSITAGIVSGTNRKITDSDGNTYIAIQTDAAINSGNSGGALVNSQGKVIGINNLKFIGDDVEGIGFAIPSNTVKSVSDQLIKYNKVKRPYMGISGIDLTEQLSEQYDLPIGVYVRSVEDFSAAQKANIKAGDVILEINGTKVETMDELDEIKNKFQIGETITLKIYRDGNEIEVQVELQEAP